MDEILSRLKKWYDHPFNSEGSVINWFLFVGLVIILAWFWSRVIARIG